MWSFLFWVYLSVTTLLLLAIGFDESWRATRARLDTRRRKTAPQLCSICASALGTQAIRVSTGRVHPEADYLPDEAA